MATKGGGGVKNFKKVATWFVHDPLYKADLPTHEFHQKRSPTIHPYSYTFYEDKHIKTKYYVIMGKWFKNMNIAILQSLWMRSRNVCVKDENEKQSMLCSGNTISFV